MDDDDKDTSNIDAMGLSPEELAAINGDDDDETEALDEIVGEDDVDEDDEKSEKTDSKAEQNAEQNADNKAATDAGGTQEDDTEEKQFVPNVTIERDADYETKLAAIVSQRDELTKQLEEGDIDLATYISKDRALGTAETDLRTDKIYADNKEKELLKEVADKWQWQQEQFFESPSNKIYGENNMLFAAFNAKTMELAAKPENEGKSGTWFLKEADREVRKLFNISKDASGKDNIVDINKNRKPDLSNIPKTLGTLPAADSTETGDNEFSYLDNLTGMEYEQAIAQIAKDPVKEARFLRQA